MTIRRKYGVIDLLRFRRFSMENPDMKPIDLIKNYNIKYPELSEEQKLENLKKFLFKNFGIINGKLISRKNELG